MWSRKNADFISNVNAQRGETGVFSCEFVLRPFNKLLTIKSAAFQKMLKLFSFSNVMAADAPMQNGETWIGRVVLHLVGLHSHQKSFTQIESLYNQICGHPPQCPPFLFPFFSFPISLSSIYKSFPSNLCSLFSSRRSLVIWFNYNCSTRQIFGKHTQINQANTDTLQLDQQKRAKLEQK